MCEKYHTNGKDEFWAFMDLEKAYDTIDRHGMWQMLRVYGVRGKLLKAVQSIYVESIGRVSGWEIMWVNGFRLMLHSDRAVWCLHGCLMYTWLFNVSHYALTNCSIYISYFIRSCCEYYLAVFHMSHFLILFVKLLTFLVGFELTMRDDLLSIESNTSPMSHGRLRTCIVICIFMLKFPLIF